MELLTVVKIYITTDEGQIEAGTIELSGKKLSFNFNDGYENVEESMQDFVCFDKGMEEVTTKEPERWLELLPSNISGSYMRAVSVE